jgi:uncharacterized SAM-binding protein YcdF (DUF218 family)
LVTDNAALGQRALERLWFKHDRPRAPWILAVAFVIALVAAFTLGPREVRFSAESPVVPGLDGRPELRDAAVAGSPGYRALAAASVAVGMGWTGIIMLQLVAASVAAIGLEGVGRALGGRGAGLVSFALFTLNPDQARWHAFLLPDSLYTSTLILTVVAIRMTWSSPTPRRCASALACGIVAGSLSAPGLFLIPIIAAAWSSTWRPGSHGGRTNYATIASSLACVALILPPVGDGIVGEPVLAHRPDRGIVIRDFEETYVPMPGSGEQTWRTTAGFAYALTYPIETLHLGALRILTAVAHVRPFYTPLHNLAVLCLVTPVYIFAVYGFIVARREPLARLLLAVIALHFLLIAITYCDWDGRRLSVIFPLIGVLAARGVSAIRISPKLILSLAICVVPFAVAVPPLLTGLAFQFRVDDSAKSDAIVLLLGGAHDRPEKVAELYRRGYGPLVLVGDDSDLAINHRTLTAGGIPPGAIVSLGPTIGTREEAWRVRDYLAGHPEIRRIVVVTTAFHTFRARWIFRRALSATGVEVRIAASNDPRFNECDWYTKVDGIRAYSEEVLKMTYACLSAVR